MVIVLLPLFFVVTGLRVQVGLLDRPELWLLTLVLLAVAIAGKWVGALGAARFTGFPPRESAAIAALMNTRGLTELIVLNIGLELGVVTPALFTALVLVALVTTFMTGPVLRLIDPAGRLAVRPEDELAAAAAGARRRRSGRSWSPPRTAGTWTRCWSWPGRWPAPSRRGSCWWPGCWCPRASPPARPPTTTS